MVNLKDDTKDRFDRLMPTECSTQDEFVALLLDHYELTDEDGQPEIAAVLERLDDLETSIPAQCELAAYRGSKDALDDVDR